MAVPGTNCLISIPEHGKTYVRVEEVTHGLKLFSLSGNNEESRTRRQFFTSHYTSGSFTIGIIFTSHDSRERFLNWLEEYARWSSNPATNPTPVRVTVPSRNFDKLGVLDASLMYGDEVGKAIYRSRIGFLSGRDPLDLTTQAGLWAYITEQRDEMNKEGSLVRYYPQGSAENSLYRWDESGTTHVDVFDPHHSGPRLV